MPRPSPWLVVFALFLPGPVLAEDRQARPWPQFRGPGASGVADGQHPPTTWDAEKGTNVRWKTPIPGLGHSCPVVWGDRLFVTTAISGDPEAGLKPGHYGNIASVKDDTEHTWKLYCLDTKTGEVVWERTAHKGVPKVKRHLKGTHANQTPATDGKHVVAGFGSEGIYCCYDFRGKLLWKIDLGVLDSGYFRVPAAQWGFGSSPVLYRHLMIVQADLIEKSFLAAYDLADGKEVWRVPRDEQPSWGTPTIVKGPRGAELVTNACDYARGYDPLTGKELWKLKHGADIAVPTPVAGHGLVFVMSGKGKEHPIFAVRAGSRGDLSLDDEEVSSDAVAWSRRKHGPYIPTPIVYGAYLYTCDNRLNLVTCYDARTGKEVYRERLKGVRTCTASPVAADGRLYFTSEQNGVHVVKAGPKFEVLAVCPLGDVCMATPAISDGMLFFRTQQFVLGVGGTDPPGEKGTEKKPTPERKALDFLSREVPRWARENECYSCHNNADAARALYVALGQGHAIKPAALADTTRWLTDPKGWAHNKGEEAFKDKKLAELQFAAALAEASRVGQVKGHDPLHEAARMTAGHQKADGSWPIDTGGTVGGATTHGTALATVLAVRTLSKAGRPDHAGALERAGEWFRKTEVKAVLDAAAVLWGLGKAEDAAARAQRQRCLEVIRKGEAKMGGWGPYVTSPPEPFDTAVVLLGLRSAPATEETRALIRRGRDYLLRTQEADGGWPETTRPAGNISYSQRISTSGWATWALLETR